MSAYKYLFKFIVVGDSWKSCLVHQFLEQAPRTEHEITVGIEFGTRDIQVQDSLIRLSLWDTAGQETFRSLIRAYYRSAIGVLLCYDATNEQSFKNLDHWVKEVKESGNDNAVVALVCNKIDLESRQVTQIDGRQFASDHGFLYSEVSALMGTGVEQLFKDMAIQVITRIESGKIAINQPGVTQGSPKKVTIINLDDTQPIITKKKSCC